MPDLCTKYSCLGICPEDLIPISLTLNRKGEREKQKKHECKKARQSKKAGESHEARSQETKQVCCSISDLYALYDFFGNFPIIQLNNINPNVI